MKAILGLCISLLLVFLSSCSESTSKPTFLFKPSPEEGVAGKIGDIKVTNAEIMDGIEADLFDAERKVFEIKFNRFKSIILQKLMDKDPRKKGLSNDEYLDKYIASKITISEKQVDQFITEQNMPSEHINPEVREKIKNFLAMEKKKVAVDSWLAEQTQKNLVEVYIPKPRRPTFAVEAGDAPSFGDNNAKVTIIEYSDFQCPYCAKGADILKQIKKKYGSKVKVVFKNFPLPFHTHAEKAAVASLCANEQGVDYFWKLHDEMFAHQDTLDPEGLKKTASKLGLKADKFSKCLDENKYLTQVRSQMDEGRNFKVKSTPTFFVNGQLVNGAQPLDVFSEIIDDQLAQ